MNNRLLATVNSKLLTNIDVGSTQGIPFHELFDTHTIAQGNLPKVFSAFYFVVLLGADRAMAESFSDEGVQGHEGCVGDEAHDLS